MNHLYEHHTEIGLFVSIFMSILYFIAKEHILEAISTLTWACFAGAYYRYGQRPEMVMCVAFCLICALATYYLWKKNKAKWRITHAIH
jgi:magnesium-transporting ATPase (P-type)